MRQVRRVFPSRSLNLLRYLLRAVHHRVIQARVKEKMTVESRVRLYSLTTSQSSAFYPLNLKPTRCDRQ